MDAIIKAMGLLVSFLVWILLHLPENLLMKENALFFNCIVPVVNEKIPGREMFSFVVKDALKLSTNTAVPLLPVS